MPHFGKRSKNFLATCHWDLQFLFNRVVKEYDCAVLEGTRTEDKQKKYVDQGLSNTMYSKHLFFPSRAIHVVPYPVPSWKDPRPFFHFAGYVKAKAELYGIGIIWGGDWDSDQDFNDQKLNDLIHFELEDES